MIEISKSVIKRNGKYLLLKRASNSLSYPDMWDFAGGKHNSNETPEHAVVRETKEETSFNIIPGNEIKKVEYYDEKHDLLFHYFVPQTISGNFKLSSDHSDFIWVNEEEMRNLDLHPSVRLFFN